MKNKIKNLVFEGGGVKGIAYVGAMKALRDQGILNEVKRVAGTSAGAINACLYALGYTVEEQEAILKELNFRKFEDGEGIGKNLKFKKILSKLFWKDFGALVVLLFSAKGLHPGSFFYDWIGSLIENKIGFKEATFLDVFEKTGIEFSVCAANLSTGIPEVFSVRETPNFEVAKAVRMSMSIPGFFAPVEIEKDGIMHTYIDGGIFKNYPIRLFDREEYVNEQPVIDTVATGQILKSRVQVYNSETLGFRLDSSDEIELFRNGNAPTPKNLSNPIEYFKAVALALMSVQENAHLNSGDFARTIYIDTQGVGAIDFDLSEEDKTKLVRAGQDAVLRHYNDISVGRSGISKVTDNFL